MVIAGSRLGDFAAGYTLVVDESVAGELYSSLIDRVGQSIGIIQRIT